jgi:hypothetical protein
LNFKYGYSVGVMVDPGTGQPVSPPREWREVRERDYFFMISFSQWGLWAGIGLAAFWQRLGEKLAGAKAIPSLDQLRRASPILVLAFLPLLLNWKYASRAGDYAARDWAYNILMSVDPYAILFTNGDNDTFPLWYLQEVEGLRRDVTVIVYSYLATPWYTKQLRDLTKPCDGLDPLADPTVITCQRPFEPDNALDIYGGKDWPAPTRSILQMDDAEVESVPDCYPVDNYGRCQLFADTVAVPIGNDVEGLVARGDYLSRNDIVVLRILQTSAGDRPIYFASTTGTYEKFALQPWMVREGVALKLSPDDVQPSPTIMPLPPQARFSGNRLLPFWVDIQKTAELLDNWYIYRDLTDWTFWPDLSTNGIPLQYYQAYAALANAYIVLNQIEASNQARDRARQFVEVALGPVDFGAPAAAPPPRDPTPPLEPPADSGEPSEN